MPRRQFDELIRQRLGQPKLPKHNPDNQNSLSLRRQNQLRSKRPDFWYQFTIDWTVALLTENHRVDEAAVSEVYLFIPVRLKTTVMFACNKSV